MQKWSAYRVDRTELETFKLWPGLGQQPSRLAQAERPRVSLILLRTLEGLRTLEEHGQVWRVAGTLALWVDPGAV